MREFDDNTGRRWQVAILFGSYGEPRMIFSCVEDGELRFAPMQSPNQREAEAELAGLTETVLRHLLCDAQPWQ